MILSHISHFLYEENFKNECLLVFNKIFTEEDVLTLQAIQNCVMGKVEKDNEVLMEYTKEKLNGFLCFQALFCEREENSMMKLPEEVQKTFCYFIAFLSNNIKSLIKSDAVVIAMIKIFQAYFEQV